MTCTFHFRDAQHVRPARPKQHRVTDSTANIIGQGTAYESIDLVERGTVLRSKRVEYSVRQRSALASALIRGHCLL